MRRSLRRPRPFLLAPGPPLLVLAAALLVGACGEAPFGPGDLSEARRLWEARGPTSYSFTYELNCFCAGPGIPPARITVTDGEVTGAFHPSSDRQVPEDDLTAYPTVRDLFEDVADWLSRDPASARTEFDPDLGHPVDVFVDFHERTADEELGFRVRELAPLERLEACRRPGIRDPASV